MTKRRVIIDCDPGHDDAMAILWALASPELEIAAITTVSGNQTINKVTNNTIKILTMAERFDIPVCEGEQDPLMGKIEVAGEIVHGESGLEGPVLPENGFKKSDVPAAEMIIKILEEAEDKITLIPLGPLTNIARVLIARPDLKNKIDVISLMGGGTIGNWTPAAEFNIWADALAAKIVFNSGIQIIMSGLDVTQKAYIKVEENEDLRKQGNKISVFAAELIDHYVKYHLRIEGFPGCTLHDPCAVAALVHPELFESEQCSVDVEVSGEITKGMTVIDRINYNEKIFGIKSPKNVKVLFGVNREGFRDEFFAAMKRLV